MIQGLALGAVLVLLGYAVSRFPRVRSALMILFSLYFAAVIGVLVWAFVVTSK